MCRVRRRRYAWRGRRLKRLCPAAPRSCSWRKSRVLSAGYRNCGRHEAGCRRPVRIVLRVVEVDAGQKLVRNSEKLMCHVETWRKRRRRHNSVDVIHRRHSIYVIEECSWIEVVEELRLLKLAPDAAIDDQFHPRTQRCIESCRKVYRLFLPPIERCIRLPRRVERIGKVAWQIIEAGRQALKLTIAGDCEIAAQIRGEIAERRVRIALAQCTVDAIAAGIDGIAKCTNRPGAACYGGRCAAFPVFKRTGQGLDTVDRIRRGAFLEHNINRTANRSVAIEDSAAVAASNFDPLDAVQRYRRKIKTLKIEILETAAVDQN